MNQPLVPTPIVDRNGKLTTVHRKASPQSEAKWTPPAVALGNESRMSAEERRRTIDAIRYQASANLMRGKNMTELYGYLNKFDDELLMSIRECQLQKPVGHVKVDAVVMMMCTATEIREAIYFSPLLDVDYPNAAFVKVLRSLRHYPQLPPTHNFAEAEDDVREKAEALMKVLMEVAFVEGTHSFIGSGNTYPKKELIDLVVSSPGKAEAIASVILDRETTDVDLIREVINNKSDSLFDGVL